MRDIVCSVLDPASAAASSVGVSCLALDVLARAGVVVLVVLVAAIMMILRNWIPYWITVSLADVFEPIIELTLIFSGARLR